MGKQLLLILLLISGNAHSQQQTDTLFFGDKTYLIKRVKTYKTNIPIFPFAVFNCCYEQTFVPYEYSGADEKDCSSPRTTFDSEGNSIVESRCEGLLKTHPVPHLLDSLKLDFDKIKETIKLKQGKNTFYMAQFRVKLIYQNTTTLLSLENGAGREPKAFRIVSEEVKANPGVKLIVLSEILYNDNRGLLYTLPYQFVIKPE